MSKPPVKAAAASKAPAKSGKTAKAPAVAAVKRAAPAAPKAKVAASAKVASAPSPKTSTRSVPKVQAKVVQTKVAQKAAPKAPAKTMAKVAPKALSGSAAAAPLARSSGKTPPVPPARGRADKPAPKPAAVKPAASSAAPAAAPPPTAVSNRFTDRFAPARPTIRPMTEAAELPKTVHKIDPKLANAWKHKAGRDLTEAELLAMPDSEYMNDKQLEFFRALLQRHKDDLLSNAGETTEHLREDTSIVPDPADRATIEEEHALELRTRDRERKLLKKVAQSLARLESGDYGFCDETGEPIGLARLLARPTATLSLEAQQRRELKQKMFGD